VVLLVGPLAAGIASSETKVGSNVDVRTIVGLKIADGEAQKLLPPGWTVNPIASGPAQGANLTMTFLDQLLNQDPEGKPAGSARTLAFGVPAKNAATGAAGNNVVRILTANTAGIPGPYKVGAPAAFRLEQSIKATDMEPAAVSERWEVRAQSGGTVTLALASTRGRYRRGPRPRRRSTAGPIRTSSASIASTRATTCCAACRAPSTGSRRFSCA